MHTPNKVFIAWQHYLTSWQHTRHHTNRRQTTNTSKTLSTTCTQAAFTTFKVPSAHLPATPTEATDAAAPHQDAGCVSTSPTNKQTTSLHHLPVCFALPPSAHVATPRATFGSFTESSWLRLEPCNSNSNGNSQAAYTTCGSATACC
jgi:hypothetical protein